VYCFVYWIRGRLLEHVFCLMYPAAVEERRQRIWDAQRTGLRNRLRDQWRLSEDRADTLLAAWEAEAASRGLPRLADGYWSAAEIWLSSQGEARRGAARPLATDHDADI
jgi:hypothetical protein